MDDPPGGPPVLTLGVAAGLAAGSLTHRRRPGPAWVAAGVITFLVVVMPLVGVAGAAALGAVYLARRLRRRRLVAEQAERDVVLLADLVALGLGAGLALPAAFDEAAGQLAPALAAEVRQVRRSMGRLGVAPALAAAGGRGERLYRLAARAAATGASLAGAVEAFAAECRHSEQTRLVEKARRLPVRLLLPLALLILPGFVVLVVGPALLESLSRLEVLR